MATEAEALATPRDLKEQAVALRLAGYSRSQIANTLGVRSHRRLSDFLRDVPPPAWTRRPNAHDDLHEKAVELRTTGLSYREIGDLLGVPKSTLSNWLSDVPMTPEHREAMKARARGVSATRVESNRARRTARDERVVAEARGQIHSLTDSELFAAGVVAYWAEGAKNKPWRNGSSVKFFNSDPDMILFFLCWLRLLGIPVEKLCFRLQIHESADVESAVAFWAETVDAPADSFGVTLKNHNPVTTRQNVGEAYHGCLSVYVRSSRRLNLQITGWFQGIAERAQTA